MLHMNEVLSWCEVSVERIDQLRRAIPIDDIFDEIFHICRITFLPLTQSIKWNFSNIEEERKFKMRKMNELRMNNPSVIRLKKNLKKILEWVFDGDDGLIAASMIELF